MTPKIDTRAASRRPHRKSRKGCLQCKSEKIKCDEHKPSCSHCVRYQSRCSFLDTVSTLSPGSDVTARPSTSPRLLSDDTQHNAFNCNPSASPLENLTATTGISLGVNDLELLHFYTTQTSFTLSNRPDVQQVWQQIVPHMAFTHHFLLHGILAFSALHLSRSQPERKILLYAQASTHHDTGLRMFQAAMNNLSPQNCEACFTFSSIIATYAWASSDQTGDLFFSDPSVSEGKSNVEWVNLLRGVYTLLQAAGEWMASGSFQSILQPRSTNPEEVRAADPEVDAKLAALSQLWESSPGKFGLDDKKVLNETLSLLRHSCGLMALSSTHQEIDMIGVVFAWPIKVPEAYFVMVRKRVPEALILLAHYSLLLNSVDKLWYMRGMSRRLLQTIHSKIGDELESSISWPLQELIVMEFKGQDERNGGQVSPKNVALI